MFDMMQSGNGDGILNSGNEIMFRDTSFFDNLAVGGGGIYVGDDNAVMMDSCHFENNIALTNGGGGISLYKQSSMHVSSTIFESNRATICGGAIESVLSNYLTISDVDMNRNRANSTGGAVCLRGGSTVDLTGTTRLYQNSALMLGGGIALLDTPLWQLQSSSDQLIFEENSANRGSAAFFAAVTQGSDHSNIVYRNNNAIIGGTVYWLKSADMPAEPAGVNSNGAVWEGNEAGYGPMLATQAIQLHGPSAYDVFVYGDVLEPPIQLSMTDYYGQFVPSDSFSTVYYVCFCVSECILHVYICYKY